jgi:UDP-N-acetylmuramate: L-alanyl-gamma-D-glutamyl-meso-diaminopimelate ligase
VLTDRQALERFLDGQDLDNTNLLLMSSGDYEGLNLTELKKYLTVQKPQ